MSGVYGEEWAVVQATEPPSPPIYFRAENVALTFFEQSPSAPGWGVRLFHWDRDRSRWSIVDSKY